LESCDDEQETTDVAPQFEEQDDGMIEFMHNINIMEFPDEIIRTHKQTGKIVPLRDIVRGPIEPTVTQLETWAVSDGGASNTVCLYQAKDIWMQHGLDPPVMTCRRMIWLRRVGIFIDYKVAYEMHHECNRLLDVFSPADAMHIRHPLTPIEIFATQREVTMYNHRMAILAETTNGETQAMMEMVKHEYLENLGELSTDIERKHMDPDFWYEQFTLDSDLVHLNNHMIEMVQKYMKGDATRMETYIDLGAVVHEFKHRKGIFARRELSMAAIRAMHADFYDLPDDTRDATYADPPSKGIILDEEVTINDCAQPLQTLSPILSSEGTDIPCITQKAHLMFEQKQLSPDWVAGLEGNTVNCEDVTIRLSTSLPILEGCLNVTCVQCENGKSISPIDSAQPTMAHDADTDSDLARPMMNALRK
jgi:hypothetical protein